MKSNIHPTRLVRRIEPIDSSAVFATPPFLFTTQYGRNHAMTPSTIRQKSLAAEFDRRIAGTAPLLDIVSWYAKNYFSTANLEARLDHGDWDCSVGEIAAIGLHFAGFKSEAEIHTRACKCTNRRGDVCSCWEALKAARAGVASNYTTASDGKPLVGTLAAEFDELFAGNRSMRKTPGGQCRNCYQITVGGTGWCDDPSCQERKRELEQGRIYDTGKRGPHNAAGDLEFTFIIIGRPDLSYDNTVWAFTAPTGGGKYFPATTREQHLDEVKKAA
jgi:hypothetical protein